MKIAEQISDPQDWQARLGPAGFVPLQQSWNYGIAAAALGARVRRLALRDGGRDIALVQVLERCGMRLISRGPVWLEHGGAAQRIEGLRLLARGLTLATPEAPLTGFGLVPLITGRFHAIWDLRPGPEALRAGLDRKWAGRLAGAERAGVAVQPGGRDELRRLVAAEAGQRRRLGYRSLPPAFTLALPPDALRLWHWPEGGGAGAAMAFVRHGDSASYHLAWAGPEARRRAVHQAMLWQAALALRAEGVRWLDLGGVDSESAPGLARFKLGTGAGLVQLGATAWVLPRWRGRGRRTPED